jgi:hypothetical protein
MNESARLPERKNVSIKSNAGTGGSYVAKKCDGRKSECNERKNETKNTTGGRKNASLKMIAGKRHAKRAKKHTSGLAWS